MAYTIHVLFDDTAAFEDMAAGHRRLPGRINR